MTWSETQQSFDDCKKIAETSTKWLREMGQDELADTFNAAVTAFDMMVNASKIVGVAVGMMSARNTVKTAEAVAETTAHATNPIGWGRIAMATAVGASAMAVTGTICTYRLRADLSNASSVEAVRQMIGTVM